MSGRSRDPRQRLGSLSADKGEEKAGRLGALRMGADPAAAGASRAGASAGAEPTGAAIGSAPAKPPQTKYVPKVPTSRRKKEAPAAAAAGPSTAGGEEFKALIENAQNDKARREARQRGGRGRGRGWANASAAPAEVAFGGMSMVKPEAKPGATGFVGGAASGAAGGRGGAGGGRGSAGSLKAAAGDGKGAAGSRSLPGGRKGARAKALTTVRKAAAGMAVDSSEAPYQSEDEAPEGPLDYGQHYPTMLPFLPPEAEAALQGGQLQGAATMPAAVAQLHDAGGSMAQYMQLDKSSEGHGAEQLMFVQLPHLLPAPNIRFKSEARHGHPQLQPPADDDDPPPRSLPVQHAPGGLIGKLKVHKSGKVKLHLGDVAFNMTHGIACEVREDAIIINAAGKSGGNALLLGDVSKHIVCTPDMMSLLS